MTTDQLALDLSPLVVPAHEPEATIQDRFEQFHDANPWIYTALESLTAGWLAKGHARVGVKQMFEVIRWQYGLATSGDRGFRMNNDFTSRYARLLVEAHPEWAAAIETRTLRAA